MANPNRTTYRYPFRTEAPAIRAYRAGPVTIGRTTINGPAWIAVVLVQDWRQAYSVAVSVDARPGTDSKPARTAHDLTCPGWSVMADGSRIRISQALAGCLAVHDLAVAALVTQAQGANR